MVDLEDTIIEAGRKGLSFVAYPTTCAPDGLRVQLVKRAHGKLTVVYDRIFDIGQPTVEIPESVYHFVRGYRG